jgi:CHASE2 domain-containing sensor protein
VGVIPTPLWLVLFVIAGLIFVFMLFFADSGEPALVQATLMGTVVAAITSILLVIGFLDSPFRPGVGSLRPVSMQRTLRVLDQEQRALGQAAAPSPCDARGASTR